jgi:hypothetical protein
MRLSTVISRLVVFVQQMHSKYQQYPFPKAPLPVLIFVYRPQGISDVRLRYKINKMNTFDFICIIFLKFYSLIDKIIIKNHIINDRYNIIDNNKMKTCILCLHFIH